MRLPLPIQGVHSAGPVADTPQGFAPLGMMLNTATFTGADGRRRLGRRPGMRRLSQSVLGRPGDRAIQGLAVVSRGSAVTSFTLGPLAVIPATVAGRRAGLVAGNAWVYSDSLKEVVRVSGSSGTAQATIASSPAVRTLAGITSGFPTTTAPSWAVPHPAGGTVALGYNYLASGQNRVLVVLIDPLRGRLVGARRIAPAGESGGDVNNVPAIAAACTGSTLFVARGRRLWRIALDVAGDRVALVGSGPDAILDPLELNTPAGAAAIPGLGRVIAMTVTAVGSVDRLLLAYDGATDAGTFANPAGSIASGATARHFRSGVAALEDVNGALRADDLGLSPLAIDPYVEVDGGGIVINHRSVRFSQELDRAPRGALPTAIAADARDGSFVVTMTQRGWGPTTAFPPDTDRPPTVLVRFDADGRKLWEVDLDSVISGERGGKRATVATTYPCDVPDEDGGNANTTTHDGPAIRAVAVGPSGLIVAAGRVSSGRFNVFACDPGAGTLRWRQRTESRNPTSGSPAWVAAGAAGGGSGSYSVAFESETVVLATGRRNATWSAVDFTPPAYPVAWAHLWKIATADGTIQTGLSPVNDEVGAAGVANLLPRCLAALPLAAGTTMCVVGTSEFTDS